MQIKKSKNSKVHTIIIGIFIIVIGLTFILGKIIYNHYLDDYEEILIQEFYNKMPEEDKMEEVEVKPKDNNSKEINYIAVIKIPTINLEKGLCAKDSWCNNVDRNIEILADADYPDKKMGNFILASHSGNSRISYFKNINKLKINDEISVFYNNKNYEYKVVNIYEIDKTGRANIIRNKNKNIITLITCKRNTNKQIIVIGELLERME